MMELQKRIDILDLWDEMPYSLDIKDFGNTVILLSESCEIRFINCIEVNIKSDILFKNKSMKFHEYRNHDQLCSPHYLYGINITSLLLPWWEQPLFSEAKNWPFRGLLWQ